MPTSRAEVCDETASSFIRRSPVGRESFPEPEDMIAIQEEEGESLTRRVWPTPGPIYNARLSDRSTYRRRPTDLSLHPKSCRGMDTTSRSYIARVNEKISTPLNLDLTAEFRSRRKSHAVQNKHRLSSRRRLYPPFIPIHTKISRRRRVRVPT